MLIFLTINLLIGNHIYAQNYGLGFYSHDKLKEQRTELNLTPYKPFKFEDGFNISFDLQFHLRYADQFGYVLRIIRNDDENIDVVYNQNLEVGTWYFHLISGQTTAKNPFTIPHQTMFKDWITFNLKFDTENGTAILSVSDSITSEIQLPFNKKDTYRIMFGACNFGSFKTRDVPVINVKDVKIHEKERLKYHWPLDQISGTETIDMINNKSAIIRNPDWLRPKHEDWVKVLNTKQSGKGQVAINLAEEIIYLIGKDQIIAFSVRDNSYEVITIDESPELLDGCQAIYNQLDNKIYSYIVDDQSFSSFDLETKKWSITIPKNQEVTVFLHHNKYLSLHDSSLYVFGGYGQHEYKNNIQKLTLNNGKWRFLETNRNIYEPRYLAAAGSKQDTVYILGGYGSPTGDQMLNPKHYSNIVAYSLKTDEIVRKVDIEVPLRDICFSNSLVFSERSRDFLVLAFPRLSDEGYLQLVKGSLDSSRMELMGKKLPFLFHDTKSYSDLFFFPISNKLVAYTSFLESEQATSVQLYTLLYPPNIMQIGDNEEKDENSLIFLFLFGGILIFTIPLLIVYGKRKKRKRKELKIDKYEDDKVGNKEEIQEDEIIAPNNKSSILFFGGFQVYDQEGTDITGKFTPLLKELFLLIWLHTLKNDKGISSGRMTEILWFDKSASSARNNKAVNIAKLRSILGEIGHCEITSKTGYWKVNCDDSEIYNDYLEFLKITLSSNNITKQNVKQLIKIVDKGAFLVNLNYDWLDEFKASVSETIIETLYAFAEKLDIKEEASLIVQTADCIFSCDSINEEAMVLKCKAHFEMGAHSLSKSTYTKFCKDYSELYGLQYDNSFADITNLPLDEIIHS